MSFNLENQENINVYGIGNQALMAKQNNGQKRTVLGQINPLNLRVQPRRAAKQGVCYEAGYAKYSKLSNDIAVPTNPTFTIYSGDAHNSKSIRLEDLKPPPLAYSRRPRVSASFSSSSSSATSNAGSNKYSVLSNSQNSTSTSSDNAKKNEENTNPSTQVRSSSIFSFKNQKRSNRTSVVGTAGEFTQNENRNNSLRIPRVQVQGQCKINPFQPIPPLKPQLPVRPFESVNYFDTKTKSVQQSSQVKNTIPSDSLPSTSSSLLNFPSSSSNSLLKNSSFDQKNFDFKLDDRYLLPPTSFTAQPWSTIASFSGEKDRVANSTLLSDCIKQTLKVSGTAEVDERKQVKPKLAVPSSFTVSELETEPISTAKNASATHAPRKASLLPMEELVKPLQWDIWDNGYYADNIYEHLMKTEEKYRPKSNYIQKQTEITANMRWILVDWLVEVVEEYKLHTECLYLAVHFVDRFLSYMSVKRDKLQLVGTTAMFIASKFEEIYPPDVHQFAYITDNTYSIGQILRMEHLVLKVLGFGLSVPTTYLFVSNFARMAKSSVEITHLAQYLCELSLLDADPFLRYRPSLIAASALVMANYTQGEANVWPHSLEKSTGYSLQSLKECYVNLNRVYCKVHTHESHSIREKYKNYKFSAVAEILPKGGFPWVTDAIDLEASDLRGQL